MKTIRIMALFKEILRRIGLQLRKIKTFGNSCQCNLTAGVVWKLSEF